MGNVNLIQSAIMQLEGGAFQKLFDAYLYKKHRFKNIQTLGVQTGTNKPTKGIPDSFVLTTDEKYILINYGSVSSQPAKKIQADIMACFDKGKLLLPKEKIKKIICGYCSTNIHIEEFDNLLKTIEGVEIELIGLDTLSHDLAYIYPHIAKDMLGITIDTNQFFDIEDFVKVYDAKGINAPINCEFLHRESELDETIRSISNNEVTILTGPSGIGKTRLALEACRKQDIDSTKVYCIKSNGNLLYEDIKYYIDQPGKYVIFFDDANTVVSLDNIFYTIFSLSDEYEVNIIITVRDYAKERVINLVTKYSKPNIIKLGQFRDDEIKDILKNDLGIINPDYLKKIVEISNGNVRLAYLAGIRSVDNGYEAIRNTEDIFKNYYSRIIEENKLNKDDIIMLFCITVAGPVKCNENKFYHDLKMQYGNGIIENNVLDNLYSLELIDWFKNEITKISDQSLGNYIIYYVLFKKKWINLESLIDIGFPRYRNKIIYVLNTLIEIFESEKLLKYVQDEIKSAWEHAPIDQEMDYLESFYQIDPDRALFVIKKHIEEENSVNFDLHSFNINRNKNIHRISTKEIEILGGYKYTDNFEDSLDLLMLYFTKRPDLIMDFFFVFSERMLYDKYSWKNKFNCELRLLEKLWSATEEGRNFNNSILYLQIATCALNTEVSFTEKTRNSRSVNYIRMSLGFTKEIASIRIFIWRNLNILRKNAEYYNIVNDVFTKVSFDRLSKEDSKKFLQMDFDFIYDNVINKEQLDFFDAIIVERFKEKAECLGVTLDERFLISTKNQEFKIYKLLTNEHELGRTLEDDKKIHKTHISKEINSYNLADYQKLFVACVFLENALDERNRWFLNNGLDCVFEVLEDDSDLYIDVINEYFNANAPLKPSGYCQIRYLIDHIGYEETYTLVNTKKFVKKDVWMSLIWECIPDEMINEQVVNDYKRFILTKLIGNNPIVPKVQELKRYGERDQEFQLSVISAMVDSPQLASTFLEYYFRDDDIETILQVFGNNMGALKKIYMNAIEVNSNIDYGGKLFIKIVEKQPEIWKEYVDFLKHNLHREDYNQKIFEMIWNIDQWKKCIDYAFEVLIDENMGFLIEQPAQLLFAKNQDNIVIERKKQWLIDKLHESSADIIKCRNLIDAVVVALPEWKLEYILEFLKNNKNVEDFKKINIFPMSYSWSGSEIPLILEKISFLKTLKVRLNGINYIEHRYYLEEYCNSLEKYREKVELREYLENSDYA